MYDFCNKIPYPCFNLQTKLSTTQRQIVNGNSEAIKSVFWQSSPHKIGLIPIYDTYRQNAINDNFNQPKDG